MVPKIGIVIPTYNHSIYLGEALESVAWQTHLPGMIVVVDDASEDDPYEVVQQFKGAVPTFFLSHEENRGPSVARNTGIEFLIENGCEAILPLDADDMMEPELIEAMLKVMPGVEMVYPDVVYFGEKRGTWSLRPRSTKEMAEFILHDNEMVNSTLYLSRVFRAVKAKNGTGYDPELHKPEHYGWEDWLFFMEAHLLGFRARGIHRALFNYRVTPNNGVRIANANAEQVWGYFCQKIDRLYGVKLQEDRWH